VLGAGQATLELLSPEQAELIDRVEVGPRVAGPVRVAFAVADSAATAEALVSAGASWRARGHAVVPSQRPTWCSTTTRVPSSAGPT